MGYYFIKIMASSHVLSMYRNLLKSAHKLKPIDKRNNAILQIKNDFRININEEDKDKVRIMLEKANSTLGYLKIVTPRNILTYEQKDSIKLVFGDINKQKQNKAVSNWSGSNLDPDSVKRHHQILKRAGFKNNQDMKGIF